MKTARYFLAIILIVGATLATAQKEERVALVIGIKEYKHVAPLQNTLNDAKDMSATLKKKGFRVVELYDPQTKREMQDAVMKYFRMIKQGTVGLVFYAGHGVQVDGANYLIPAGANPMIKADLEDQCMSMDYVMGAIEEAGNPLNIFILDACRNNPFRSFSRSAGRGLNTVSAPKGSYVVYSTKPGSVASDGTGRNGLFTSKLLKYINTPGLNIEQVFKKVAGDVSAESGGDQRPWISSDYTDDFFFIAGQPSNTHNTANNNVSAPTVFETVTRGATLLAHYPLLYNGKDLTANNGEVKVEGTTIGAGFCQNGTYIHSKEGGQNLQTPSLQELNVQNMIVAFDFKIVDLRWQPILVGGRSGRWLGVQLTDKGEIGVLYNNSEDIWSDQTVAVSEWYSVLLVNEGGQMALFLNDKNILEAKLPTLKTYEDLHFTTNNFAVGSAFKGCIKNLRIYSK